MNPFLGHLLERSFATTEGLRPRLPSLFEPVSTDVPGNPPAPFGTAGPDGDQSLDNSDRQEDTAGLRVATSAQEVEIGPLGEINPTLPSARIRADNSRSAPMPMPATGANRVTSAPEEPSEPPIETRPPATVSTVTPPFAIPPPSPPVSLSPAPTVALSPRITSSQAEPSESSVETRPLAAAPAVTPPVAIASPSPPVSPTPAPTVAISRRVANTLAEPSESPAETRPAVAIPPAPPPVSVAPFGPPPSPRQVADRIAPHGGQARRPVGSNPVEWPSSAASDAGPAERHPGASATESRLAGAGPTALIERIVQIDHDPLQPTPKVATPKVEWRERLIESPPLEGNSVTPPPAPQPPAAPQSRKPADSAAAPGMPQRVVPQQTRLALRPVSLPPVAPAASARPSVAPTIQVTIGRIEVRATPPAPATPRKAPPKPAAMSLEDYLKQRSEGRR